MVALTKEKYRISDGKIGVCKFPNTSGWCSNFTEEALFVCSMNCPKCKYRLRCLTKGKK